MAFIIKINNRYFDKIEVKKRGNVNTAFPGETYEAKEIILTDEERTFACSTTCVYVRDILKIINKNKNKNWKLEIKIKN